LLIISKKANTLPVVREPAASVTARPTLSEFEVVFDALAHEARRHIVQLLAHYGPELPSGYLAKRFTHSWPTTTRHLHVLEAAGIVSVRRDGRSCIYRLQRDRLERVLGGWLALLEPPSPGQTWRSPRPRSVRKEALL
jgi:DNA-binding transcriptional ArsR family regulator